MEDAGGSGLSQDMRAMDLSVELSELEKKFLYEVVENHIIQFSEIIQAHNLLKRSALHLDSTWSSWDRLQEVLQALGFRWHAGDSWLKLGFSLHEGPTPSLSSIEQRWDMAQFLLTGARGRPHLVARQGDIDAVE